MRVIDFTGKEFGCVKVVKRIGSNHHGAALWDCVCTCGCGTHKAYASSTLITMGDRKHPRKCLQWSHHTSHGGADSRLYHVWQGMKTRCTKPNYKYWKDYGGRGITYCKEWEDFEAFQEWALENGYDEHAPQGKCTLDRIDNNGNYEPSNCRWVDGHTQNMNRRVKKTDIRPQLDKVLSGEITQRQAAQNLGISESSWHRLRREAKQEVKHCTKEQILKYIERQERREITVEQALKELRISNITWYKIKKERNN